jgi:hypothetical protein
MGRAVLSIDLNWKAYGDREKSIRAEKAGVVADAIGR